MPGTARWIGEPVGLLPQHVAACNFKPQATNEHIRI